MPFTKQFAFIHADGSPSALQARALERLANAPWELSLNIVEPHGDILRWHLVIELWSDDPAALNRLLTEIAPSERDTVACYQAQEVIEKDQPISAGWPLSGVRLIAAWTRPAALSALECRRHWDEHVPLANRIHVGVVRYVRNWITNDMENAVRGQPPYQGIASQHYPSERDLLERAFDSPQSVKIIEADVAEFIDHVDVLRVTEYRRMKLG